MLSCLNAQFYEQEVSMRADENKCIGCKRCFPYCPLGRIQILLPHPKIPGRVYIEINQDKCTDCGMCFRANVCAVDALYQPAEPWPREVRAILTLKRLSEAENEWVSVLAREALHKIEDHPQGCGCPVSDRFPRQGEDGGSALS